LAKFEILMVLGAVFLPKVRSPCQISRLSEQCVAFQGEKPIFGRPLSKRYRVKTITLFRPQPASNTRSSPHLAW